MIACQGKQPYRLLCMLEAQCCQGMCCMLIISLLSGTVRTTQVMIALWFVTPDIADVISMLSWYCALQELCLILICVCALFMVRQANN